MPILPAEMKILPILLKTLEKEKLNPSRSALFHTKIRVSLIYSVNYCLWKRPFAPNSPQTVISLTILIAPTPFTQFKPKIRAIKLQKCAKICLTW